MAKTAEQAPAQQAAADKKTDAPKADKGKAASNGQEGKPAESQEKPVTNINPNAKAAKGFNAGTYLYWYENMLLMRRFEEKAASLYGQAIRGFLHLYIGQEAIAAAMMTTIQPGDKVITAYRDHAHAMAMGIPPKEVMAELFGKTTGCSHGKGGSMHMFSKEHNFFGGHGIVGAQIPMGAGIAFAEKYKKTGNVCLCFMGDGAVRQGALHETFTLAMLWKLPVVFVCENNEYGMGTAVERTTNVPDLYKIGASYEMPSFQVNGMQCEPVHTALAEAIERARTFTPTFLEIKTYRYKGHSMSDPAKYRTREELDEYRAKDPIEHVLQIIQNEGFATEEQIEQINEKVKQEVEEAVQFADQSPFPDPSEIYDDIYMQNDYPYLTD